MSTVVDISIPEAVNTVLYIMYPMEIKAKVKTEYNIDHPQI